MEDDGLGCTAVIILTLITIALMVVLSFTNIPGRYIYKGYVSSIEYRPFCTIVEIKTDLENSEEKRLSIPKYNENVESLLSAMSNKTSVEITTDVSLIRYCGDNVTEVK